MNCSICNGNDISFVETRKQPMKAVRRLILLGTVMFMSLNQVNMFFVYFGLFHLPMYIAFRIFDGIRCNNQHIKAVCRNCGNVWLLK